MMHRFLALAVLSLAVAPSIAAADSGGALDPTFGDGGRVLTTLNTSAGPPTAAAWVNVLPQPDGKIITVGSATFGTGPGANSRVVLARYTAAGALDPSFAGGRVLLGTPGSPSTEAVEAVQVTNGDLVILAWSRFDPSTGDDNRAVLMRVAGSGASAGRLVDGFGAHGITVVPTYGGHPRNDRPTGLAFAEGRLLVARAEDVDSANPHTAVISAYDPLDGDVIDAQGFNPGGHALYHDAGVVPEIGPLAAFQSGAMLAIGDHGTFAAVRIDKDGFRIDPGFNTRLTSFSGATAAKPEAIDVSLRQDRIVVAGGITVGGQSQTAIARFKADGGVDSAFASGGRLTIDLPGSDRASDVALLPDGRMLVASEITTNDRAMALMRLLPNGALDTSFGGDGIVLDRPYGSTVASSLAVAADGDDVLAAGHEVSQQRVLHFALARFSRPQLRLASCLTATGCLTLLPIARSATAAAALIVSAEPSSCARIKPPCTIALSLEVTRVQGTKRTPVGTVNLGSLIRAGGLRWDLRVRGKLLAPGKYEIRVGARRAAQAIIKSRVLSIQIKRVAVGITPIPIP